MAEIDPYIRVVFFLNLPKIKIPDKYLRREAIVPSIREELDIVLGQYNAELVANNAILAETYFDALVEDGAFDRTDDPFAGSYYRYLPTTAEKLRETFLGKSNIFGKYATIGDRFFEDVFSGYLGIAERDEVEVVPDVQVPASDRIVTINHNQISEIASPLDELISSLEADNGVPDRPGLKERILGQIRAGRELIRVGTFRAYLLYVTLLQGLTVLVDKYKDHAIGAVAAALIELLVKHVFEQQA